MEQRIFAAAEAGVSPGQDAVGLLRSWRDPTFAAEQKATGEYLVRMLDEDRTSERKLFPPDLQGVTW